MPLSAATVPMAGPDQVLESRPRALIDLRSPAEYAEDHLPGAVNVPLFDDLDRAVVGTLYHRRSPEEAFAEGRARSRDRIGALATQVAELTGWAVPPVDLAARVERMTAGGMARLEHELRVGSGLPGPHSVLLYCWRGGLRSRSVLAFLRGLGLTDAIGLEGGYRAYRGWVRRTIEAWRAPATFVLRGLTGVGKTLVLRELERLETGWTLDLEGLAGHRSSILGMVGLEPASQKLFESRLAQRLVQGFSGPCVVEGESRKVGDVILPGPVWEALQGGVAIQLVAPSERRVEVLMEDYLATPGSRAELAERLPFLEKRLGQRWRGELVARLESGREAELVEILLERYYDPLYRHSEARRDYAFQVDARDPSAAARQIATWIREREVPFATAAGGTGASRARPAL